MDRSKGRVYLTVTHEFELYDGQFFFFGGVFVRIGGQSPSAGLSRVGIYNVRFYPDRNIVVGPSYGQLFRPFFLANQKPPVT